MKAEQEFVEHVKECIRVSGGADEESEKEAKLLVHLLKSYGALSLRLDEEIEKAQS